MADLPAIANHGRDFQGATHEAAADVAVGAGGVSLGEINLANRAGFVVINIKNTGGTNAFTACSIDMQAHPNSGYRPFLTSAQLNTGTPIANLLVSVSDNPTTLAAGAEVNIIVQANRASRLRVNATSAAGTTARLRAASGSN